MAARITPPHSRPVNDEEVVRAIKSKVRWWGDQTRLAKEIGVDSCRISRVLQGKDPVSDRIAAGLGFKRVSRWERIR